MEYFDINDPQIKCRVIVENELAFAFPGKMPIVPGHTLIVPKRPIAIADDLSKEELLAIFDLRNKLKVAMEKTFGTYGFNYAWNEGKNAGQSVAHFHLHILPRKDSDSGIVDYEPRKFLYRPGERADSPEQELIDVAECIKKNL